MEPAAKLRQTSRCRRAVILVALCFIVAITGIVVGMNVKNALEMQRILEESIKSQLMSICIAAREMLDVDRFDAYGGEGDVLADAEAYQATLQQLRQLCTNVGAQYIYALKKIDGVPMFVFDTDVEDEEIFIEYDLSPVHEAAFAGSDAADVLNVTDAYGSYNTGAVPIRKDGRVIGIMCTDIEDTFLHQSNTAARSNLTMLIITLGVAMAAALAVVLYLLKRVRKMQAHLEHLAHYDTITGLPNRQYLLEFLAGITADKEGAPFALLFIDLDNFKMVNDNAGHEAGDELLRHIAAYLEKMDSNQHIKAFRPSAGRLNIAARIGGDEFVQVVSGIATYEEAAAYAQRLLDGFASQKVDRYVEKYAVGLSIGIALYPYHADSFHTLIKYADIAMYHAKRAGKNSYRIFEDEMGRDMTPELLDTPETGASG